MNEHPRSVLNIEKQSNTENLENLENIDYESKTLIELRKLCREMKIKCANSKKKPELINLLLNAAKEKETEKELPVESPGPISIKSQVPRRQEIITGDSLLELPKFPDESAQIILADPPYNIGKDFGNNSDKQPMDKYLEWTDKWVAECLRILKPNGTMFIYGFSEILALILARIPSNINRRWIVWHYTNKNVASLNFWQRSHESIIVLWKEDYVFNKDDIREAYTEGFLNNAVGRERTSTKGRFSQGVKKTTYTAHPNGALPRDVIKIPALAGGAGMKERVNHPTQKPLALCEKLLLSCRQPNDAGYVLVPFAGSGSECVAAKKLDLDFVGIELNPEYVEIIKTRLSELDSDKKE